MAVEMASLGKFISSVHAHTIGGTGTSIHMWVAPIYPDSEIAPPGIVIKLIKRSTCLGPAAD